MLPKDDFYASGALEFQIRLEELAAQILAPPPILKISEWAAKYGQLSKETSATTGDFEAFPYQNGILDAACNPKTPQFTVMKSARVGYTKCLDLITAYYIHQDPSPGMTVQPRVEDAEDYSKTEIMPMIRDTPVLQEIAGDIKAKDSSNTIQKKTFKNGASWAFIGANAPGGFRRVTVRVALFDEVSGYPVEGAGNEGDQIKLGTKRTTTFWNRVIGVGSTPTVVGFCRITSEFAKSDQRYFFVPCPHCGQKQVLEWGGADKPFGFKWEHDENGVALPDTVYYLCRHCGEHIHEKDKRRMVEAGEWIATKPEIKGHAGFHIWAAYSFFPNAAWAILVREWHECKNDPLQRQTFWNTVLGLPYEDSGEGSISTDDLLARRADWEGFVPHEAKRITIGMDVQDYSVEAEVVAWDDDEQSWSLDYVVFDGAFNDVATQNSIDDFISQKRFRNDGTSVVVSATCIDSGGHHTQAVYDFCKKRLGRKIFAVKGESARGGARNPVWPTAMPKKRSKKSYRPTIIGVNAAKDNIRNRLFILAPGPGYCHFPVRYGEGYFKQLTAEKLVRKLVDGRAYRVWELPPGRANEALDCRVYAYAALCSLKQFGIRGIGDHRAHAPATVQAKPAKPQELEAPMQERRAALPPIVEKAVSVKISPTTPAPAKTGQGSKGSLSKRLA